MGFSLEKFNYRILMRYIKKTYPYLINKKQNITYYLHSIHPQLKSFTYNEVKFNFEGG
ncbi:hypothetical protein J18TS1_17590 [Oceanobacillus oncorhynchi subsp. incaldanensis]|nr:hypothetical protein J18TS1_17590 [Oceanobacillus oncorhynchi subsp. incaldanensis]